MLKGEVRDQFAGAVDLLQGFRSGKDCRVPSTHLFFRLSILTGTRCFRTITDGGGSSTVNIERP